MHNAMKRHEVLQELIKQTRKITGDPVDLDAEGSLVLQRSELPYDSLGDVVSMWLKAETPLGGRHARMECVEMTSDTLTFREVPL